MTNLNYKLLMTAVHKKLHHDPKFKNTNLSVWNMTMDELLAINFSTVVNG